MMKGDVPRRGLKRGKTLEEEPTGRGNGKRKRPGGSVWNGVFEITATGVAQEAIMTYRWRIMTMLEMTLRTTRA